MIVIDLHRRQTPFAVIVSHEIVGDVYSILYQDRYLRCIPMDRYECRWFNDNKYLFKIAHSDKYGKVYEYSKFKKKMNQALKHNFLVRNKIITGGYI
jgi:hypothetical protein